MTKTPKIAKAKGRSVKEWIGKTPDSAVPLDVQLRVKRRFDNKCYLTGIIIADGQPLDMEHIKPLEEGGEHRESNLAPALRLPHEIKTAAEKKRRAKADRIAKKGAGIARPAAKIQSPDFPAPAPKKHASGIVRTPVPGQTNISRRFQ